tara:strand:+ start:2638 stop:2781 length:144 start_codon:yes stop_codon:yes gene_type:complete
MLIVDYSIQKKHSIGNCVKMFKNKKALAPGCDFLSKARFWLDLPVEI